MAFRECAAGLALTQALETYQAKAATPLEPEQMEAIWSAFNDAFVETLRGVPSNNIAVVRLVGNAEDTVYRKASSEWEVVLPASNVVVSTQFGRETFTADLVSLTASKR